MDSYKYWQHSFTSAAFPPSPSLSLLLNISVSFFLSVCISCSLASVLPACSWHSDLVGRLVSLAWGEGSTAPWSWRTIHNETPASLFYISLNSREGQSVEEEDKTERPDCWVWMQQLHLLCCNRQHTSDSHTLNVSMPLMMQSRWLSTKKHVWEAIKKKKKTMINKLL